MAKTKTVREIIKTSEAPVPVGPYNQAVKVGNMVYLSAVLGFDPTTNQLVKGLFENEVRQVFKNLGAILKAADSGFDKLVKVTIWLRDIKNFNKVNEIYKEYITDHYPARCTYEFAKIPVDANIEIEVIALCGEVETQLIRK